MKVLVYPFDSNPYQKLLYSPMEDKGVKIKYLNKVVLPIPTEIRFFSNYPLIFLYRLLGFKIFHLHWPAFNFPFRSRYKERISYYNSLIFLRLIKLLGFKLVWTIHNIVPHESQTGDDKTITREILNLSDANIAHSHQTLEDLRKLKFKTKNSYIIQHGNFIGYYPNNISRQKARKELGLAEDEIVFLFTGKIRLYKGLGNFLREFDKLNIKKTKIIIAGKTEDDITKREIEKYNKNKKIIIHDEYIKDEDFQVYMNASDICVYPFKKITTSGSIMLGLSFGKPVLYRNIGGLKELPKKIGFSYENDSELGGTIIESIKKARDLKEYSKNALKYARYMSWDKIARKTLKIYKKLEKMK